MDKDCYDCYNRIVDADETFLNTTENSNFMDRIILAKEDVQRKIISNIVHKGISEVVCSGGKETAVMYPTGNIAGCELREDILGNLRETDYDFSKIWFSEKANNFRKLNGQLDVCKACYHHCFISPALFRSPSYWPDIIKKIWK